ncbi:hypothetical protein YC2023_085049 [Brassica napus]
MDSMQPRCGFFFTHDVPVLHHNFTRSYTIKRNWSLIVVICHESSSVYSLLTSTVSSTLQASIQWEIPKMQKANPNNKYLREDSFEDFEELQMIFGQNTATGQNAVGLGDDVNPFNSQIEDCDRANDISFV